MKKKYDVLLVLCDVINDVKRGLEGESWKRAENSTQHLENTIIRYYEIPSNICFQYNINLT